MRPQQYRLQWPLTASQVESIDTMFETLFKAGARGLAGVQTYYVADTSGGSPTRKLTFTDGLLTAQS